jgi:pyruvate-formate lyase-activating enzyme
LEDHHPVSLYFNITTGCNSACQFCASNSPSIPGTTLSVDSIFAIFEKYAPTTGDDIVINGGEPTTFPDLPRILLEAIQSGALVTLFTNGRRLSNARIAEKILLPRLHRISIPLYGSTARTHDGLTCTRGSFEQTVQGIDRIFSSQKRSGYPRQIEIKLLAIRPALTEWPAIIKLIHDRWGVPERIVLSGLIFSQEVLKRKNQLIPTMDELRTNINETLKVIIELEMQYFMWNIPLCSLEPQYRKRHFHVPDQRGEPFQDIYIDPAYPEGIQLKREQQTERTCKKCELTSTCGTDAHFYEELQSSRKAG